MKTITLSGRKRRLSAQDVELAKDILAEVENRAFEKAKAAYAASMDRFREEALQELLSEIQKGSE